MRRQPDPMPPLDPPALGRNRRTPGFWPLWLGSVLLPLLILAGAAAWSWQQAEAGARARLARSAAMLQEHGLRAFETQEALLSALQQFTAGMAWQNIAASPAIADFLKRLVANTPGTTAIGMITPDGRLAHASNLPFPSPRLDLSQRDYVQALHGPDRPPRAIGEVVFGIGNRQHVFLLARSRIDAAGRPDGSIFWAALSPNSFSAFYTTIVEALSDEVLFLREDGALLARYPPLDPPEGQWEPPASPPLQVLRSALDAGGVAFLNGPSPTDQRDRLWATVPIAGYPAAVVYGLDWAVVRDAWRQQLIAMAAAAVAAAAVLLCLTGLAQIRARREQEALEQARAEAEHRMAAERAYRESETRFRDAIAEAPFPVILQAEDGEILQVSRALTKITGYPPAAIGTINAWKALAFDERQPPTPAEVEALFGAQSAGTPVEREIRTQDGGRRRWAMASAPLGRDGSGRRLAVTMAADVTERSEMEQRQTLLAREVDHRAKNTLAVVQSIIRLSRAEDAREFARVVAQRVAALARAHDLLARDRWYGTELRSVLQEELAAYLGASRVELQGAPLRLIAEAVQPLSMVIHELTTNAAKFGALSQPGGRLRLSWFIFGPASDRRLRLRWEERDGPPLAGPPARLGFGSRLVQATVEGQLGGEASTTWAPEGLRFELTVPLRRIAGTAGPQPEGGAVPPAPMHSAPPEASRLAPTGRLSGLSVLVVEDEALVGMDLARELTMLGCEVVGPAATLEEALRLARDHAGRIGAAVLDVNLGGVASFPVADLLTGRAVPVIFATGYSELPEGQGNGAAAVLRKPVSPDALQAALCDAIGAGRAE